MYIYIYVCVYIYIYIYKEHIHFDFCAWKNTVATSKRLITLGMLYHCRSCYERIVYGETVVCN